MKQFTYSAVCFLILIGSLSTFVKADTMPEKWSKIIYSRDKRYFFAMISPDKAGLEKYGERMRAFWASGGIPKENIPAARRDLADQFAKEEAIRAKYPRSGVYRASDDRFLWALDLYEPGPQELIRLSNDGDHLIHHRTYISAVLSPNANISSDERMEDSDIYPNREESVLEFYSEGKLLKAYSAKDLVPEKLGRGLNEFFEWSTPGVLDESSKRFTIKKLNKDVLTFDVISGERLDGNLTVTPPTVNTQVVDAPNTERNGEACLGIVLIGVFSTGLAILR